MIIRYIFTLGILLNVFLCKNNINGDIQTEENFELSFFSSDSMLENSFKWAKSQALDYVGDSNDPVGPWYEAALPGREAFCMRDVSHQCIGAEILGLSSQNLNMFLKFAENISESKDWCTYWEINRYNLPAPVDYKNDEEFWYNLPSSFDVISACWRHFCWTGIQEYISNDIFLNFYEKSLTDYIDRWQLQPDRIMDRPKFMNLPSPFDSTKKYFHICCRGLPSYVETSRVPISCSADLIASIYSAFISYSNILALKGETEKSRECKEKAEKYKELLESRWWNEELKTYHTFWTEQKEFHKGQGELFLLWFDIVQQPERIQATFANVLNYGLNVESLSYLPVLYSKYGYYKKAYDQIISLSNPAEKRRSYPEVSFAVIEGIVRGLMGIDSFTPESKITTCPKLISTVEWVELKNLEIMGTLINVKYKSNTSCVLENKGDKDIAWKAMFAGQYQNLQADGTEMKAKFETDRLGNTFSFVEILVKKGSSITVELKTK